MHQQITRPKVCKPRKHWGPLASFRKRLASHGIAFKPQKRSAKQVWIIRHLPTGIKPMTYGGGLQTCGIVSLPAD